MTNDLIPGYQMTINIGDPEASLEQLKPFTELMTYYKCALYEIETKLNVLNTEFSSVYNHNPIESIKTRLKKPTSIAQKMRRRGLPLTIDAIRRNLNDIAGIRVICGFPEDIYLIAAMLAKQDDIRVIETKDYIKNPKPNGYRSLHLILEVPIFLSTQKKFMRVEVQFRTIAMDFWASLEHQMKYKQEIPDAERISRELRECSDQIALLDHRMQQIRSEIQSYQ